MSDNCIFALDIGTRSVVGVVLQEGPRGLEIVAAEQLEHETRAMVDGQIHDIEQVSKALSVVKERLEAKVGLELKQVAVAAAGRALKTVRLKIASDCSENMEIQQEDILRLELQAVQNAQQQLEELYEGDKESLQNYHCVGYSVVQYELDNSRIGNLYLQKGSTMSIEVIATFLPRVVVDSMLVALKKAGLEMVSLTLEPIAASTVVVPSTMRQLNIALVDIGAGTSDIAVTANGSIIGFGMAPVAGDEVTEAISGHFLVDFNEAEKIKRTLINSEDIKFTDILGIEHIVSQQEVLDVIAESVTDITKQISEKIIELNGKTPQAVICIGGGSLTPLLKEFLADNLGLAKQRVAVRGREAIAEVSGALEMVGPEVVTPIGIAVTSHERKGLGFAKVYVNGNQIRLFEVNRCSVADALVAAGISIRKTQPRLGPAITVTVNGELKIIKGSRGKPAAIMLNGDPATLDAVVKNQDSIEFTEAVDGEKARGIIYDVLSEVLPLSVVINGRNILVDPHLTMNGKPASYNDELVDNAQINYSLPQTVKELVEIAGITDNVGRMEQDCTIYINERIADFHSPLQDGDDIIIESIGNNQYFQAADKVEAISEIVATESVAEQITTLTGENTIPTGSGTTLSGPSTTLYVNDETVVIDRTDIIVADILTRVSFPLKPPEPGLRLQMKVNGISAEFTTPLKHGDKIELDWKN